MVCTEKQGELLHLHRVMSDPPSPPPMDHPPVLSRRWDESFLSRRWDGSSGGCGRLGAGVAGESSGGCGRLGAGDAGESSGG